MPLKINEINSKYLCDRQTAVCFTGHRPEKFPFDRDDSVRFNMLKSLLYCKICDAYRRGYRTFITGMARGVDMWAAVSVITIKKKDPTVKLIGVSPYKKEYDRLTGTDRWDYSVIREYADEMIYLSDDYFPGCFHRRNNFMVSRSSLVIGVVYDYNSGTGRTLAYAAKKGIAADIIDVNSLDCL